MIKILLWDEKHGLLQTRPLPLLQPMKEDGLRFDLDHLDQGKEKDHWAEGQMMQALSWMLMPIHLDLLFHPMRIPLH